MHTPPTLKKQIVHSPQTQLTFQFVKYKFSDQQIQNCQRTLMKTCIINAQAKQLEQLTQITHTNLIGLKKIGKLKNKHYLYYQHVPFSLTHIITHTTLNISLQTLHSTLNSIMYYLMSLGISPQIDHQDIGVNEIGIIKIYLNFEKILNKGKKGNFFESLKQIVDWYQKLYEKKFPVQQFKNEIPTNHQRKYFNDSIYKQWKNPNKKQSNFQNKNINKKTYQFRKLSLNPQGQKQVCKDNQSIDTQHMDNGEILQMPSVWINERIKRNLFDNSTSWDTLTKKNFRNPQKKNNQNRFSINNASSLAKQCGVKRIRASYSGLARDNSQNNKKIDSILEIKSKVSDVLWKTKSVMQLLKKNKSNTLE